ncbi:MAG: tetratricopeptide repeat protein [Acidobacteriaceae bacterium]
MIRVPPSPRTLVAVLLALACAYAPGQTPASDAQQRSAAIALEQQGETVEAEAAWQAIFKAHPADAEACGNIGFLESQQKHYPQAVRYYSQAAALNPTLPGLQMNLGLALFKAGRMKEATRVFLPLYREANPDSPDAQRLRLLIGMADYGASDYAAAVPFLREAMARDPQNLPYRLVLAHSCLWSKQYKCVLDVYHQILSLNAESAEADMLAGEAYDEMRDHDDAIQQFRNAVRVDPRVPGVHFGLGYLLWCQNHFEEAAQQFQLEADNTPRDAQTIAYWADSEVHLNHLDAARPLLQRALKLNDSQELPWLDLGIIDAKTGHNDDAIREFKRAVRLTPSDSQVHWRLARLYQSIGMRSAAQAEFEKTKNLNKVENEQLVEKLHPEHLTGAAQ